jgi:hypothetical protein
MDEESRSLQEEEVDLIKYMKLNEVFALDMQKSGLNAEPMQVGSLALEKEEYYNNELGSTPRIVTNKGCIRLKDRVIDLVQIIQRN